MQLSNKDFPKVNTGGTARGMEGDRIGSREPSTSAELSNQEKAFKPSPSASTHETYLWGYVKANYHELVAAFGKPHHTQLDKGTMQWVFQAKDNRVFTIYDYNEDDMAPPPIGLYDWHIGGHKMVDGFVAWVNRILDKQRKAVKHEITHYRKEPKICK